MLRTCCDRGRPDHCNAGDLRWKPRVAVFPPPAGMPRKRSGLARLSGIAAAKAWLVSGSALGSFVGAWVGRVSVSASLDRRIGRGLVHRRRYSDDAMVISHPLWMDLAGILSPFRSPRWLRAYRPEKRREPNRIPRRLRARACRAMLRPLQYPIANKENKATVRRTLGIIVGALVAVLAGAGCLYASARCIRRISANFATPESPSAYAPMPSTAIAWILGGWALAGLLGGWTSAKISRPDRGAAALAIGAAARDGDRLCHVHAETRTDLRGCCAVADAVYGGGIVAMRRSEN